PLACAVRAVAPVSNILRRLFPSPPHGDQSKYFKYYRAESINRRLRALSRRSTKPEKSLNK
ncbi:MAG: hypothetical protein FWD77_11995, partial [Betaproteobacteria bacterium]|nr:hypothetical protein [Betaproteobacteria bacterium]